jgi:hypothetical protein
MSERRGFVAFGDVLVVEFAFGVDAPLQVVGSGAWITSLVRAPGTTGD